MDNRQVVFYHILLIGLVATNPPRNFLSDRRYCGYQHTDDYPRPNSNISIDEFPWMVQLLDKDLSVLCSGSLISNRYVLTAAHCVPPIHTKVTMVRLGDYNVKTENDCVNHNPDETECSDPVEQIPIGEIIVHPFYQEILLQNDIALIRLAEKVTYSEFIRPICLPKKDAPALKHSDRLSTSGWGLLGADMPKTDLKKRLTVTLISTEECTEAYRNKGRYVNSNQLCATDSDSFTCMGDSDSFTCMGDSGAPLMYSLKNQWEQVGIISFSNGCSDEFPTVYVKVSNYLNWIKETVKP